MTESQKDSPTDEELMVAYQHGNEQAFETLYRRYSARVHGYLRTKVSDRSLLEDVFQGTFLKLHRARAHYDPTYPFAPWLFTVCRSVLTDSLRKQARIQDFPDEEAVQGAVAPDPSSISPARGPDLGSLPASQRKAIELRYQSDLSFEEIARQLETSPANVRQLVSRAIRRLRRQK